MIDPILGLGLVVLVLAMVGKAKGGSTATPNVPGDAGKPGNGPAGSPAPARGGRVYGRPKPGSRGYTVPAGFDPVRGLWISPDCEMVVEGPGFWIGLGGPPGTGTIDPTTIVALPAQSLVDVAADPTNGAFGFVDFWAESGLGPAEIVTKMMVEAAPMCGQLPRAQWGSGLAAWFDASVSRIQRYLDAITFEGP